MNSEIMQGYFNQKQAAVYTGYAYSTFREAVAKYALPKCGPKRNRFSKADLDAFMENPLVFLAQKPVKTRRHSGGFRPVTV